MFVDNLNNVKMINLILETHDESLPVELEGVQVNVLRPAAPQVGRLAGEQVQVQEHLMLVVLSGHKWRQVVDTARGRGRLRAQRRVACHRV